MSNVYESIMTGLNEAVEDSKSYEKKLTRRVVTVIPVKEYNASEVKKIRNSIGMSQKTFASYLGVSCKTVEAWEKGTNHQSGAASRLLNMMEMDENLTKEFPFVQLKNSWKKDRKIRSKVCGKRTLFLLRIKMIAIYP